MNAFKTNSAFAVREPAQFKSQTARRLAQSKTRTGRGRWRAKGLALVANPYSGCGSSARKLASVEAELKRRGVAYQLTSTESLEDAERLSREANLAGFPVVVAIGGDGTINRVLNGFFDEEGNRISEARLGVIHTGSSPDFCRSYGVPTQVEPAIETLLDGYASPLRPVGIVCQREEKVSSVYSCCANIGLGAEVARGANSGSRRGFGDFVGTFLSLLRALRRNRPFEVQIELDGASKVLDGVLNIAVGRTYYVASGLKVKHELPANDARVYVLTLRRFSWCKLGFLLSTLYCGRPIRNDSCLTLEYAGRVEVQPAGGQVEVEFDGDPAGWCPCTIQAAPATVDLICRRSI